ncbi:hypothetical protein ACFYM2_29065 [Streptomyces sp. NPDC006711]|uniref:hypothetical protein n=1 Tax=Streptomyces sp. NPDC006711 TaxID=3364762 RepID=UPI0036B55E77
MFRVPMNAPGRSRRTPSSKRSTTSAWNTLCGLAKTRLASINSVREGSWGSVNRSSTV